MKTWNHLFERIVDYDNLALAVWKAQRGKSSKREVRDFCADLERGLAEVRDVLLTGDVGRYDYHFFKIFDPKERTICAAPFPLRVVHHALMNVCGPLMDARQIGNSFACQKGKGQYAAIERARGYHRCFRWCLKLDVRKYFDTIRHDVLKAQLSRLFRERRLLDLFAGIVDSYSVEAECGLPIGNLTSQYLANHYLCAIDHFAQERLHIGGYVRYMDDILLWGNDREVLLAVGRTLREKMASELGLSLKTFCLRRTAQTTEFLGYRLVKHDLLLSQRSMRRFRRKMKDYRGKYEGGVWGEHDYLVHIEPLTAFVLKSTDVAFRRKVV